jgi:hypothetical protein
MAIIDLINVREVKPEDLRFLMDSAVRNLKLYMDDFLAGRDVNDLIKDVETTFVTGINKLGYTVLVACDKDDEDSIYGYCMADTKNNHIVYNYTKYHYRLLGLQKYVLMPLLIDFKSPVTVQYPTAEALRAVKNGKVTIKDGFKMALIELLKEKENESD